MRELSLASARRVALAAQGFGRPRPQRPITMRDVQGQIDRLAQFQVDSINVLARAHQLPLYSRLGAYDTALLDRAAGQAPRRLFEYWGHAASMVDVRLEPALRFRMARARDEAWGGMRRIAQEQPDLVARVRREVAERGPVTARQLEAPRARQRDHWGWNWSDTKRALEWLFWCGEVTAARRNASFEREYDLPERVLPPAVLQTPTPSSQEAHVVLVRRAARALGVASERCLADYFRLGRAETRRAIATLEELGEMEPVTVAGWSTRAWLWTGDGQPRIPRRIHARALISPFDPLIFERSRALSLFGLDYRIEIYVPQARRRHGYYVHPFLVGEEFAARVDLKADRAASVLRVKSSWLEEGTSHPVDVVTNQLADELELLARWLGLGAVVVDDAGDLADALAAEVQRRT
ncbi:winged helix-turn-helix domain-containing protein [Luteococcus sp. Sow4_B9]|uniref:winged helix-turn-helix domain-containing protein n=1 Tax=Luteococcus sp. Sow4_B9 TaxID=3438792 RepID=UPI003F9E3C07